MRKLEPTVIISTRDLEIAELEKENQRLLKQVEELEAQQIIYEKHQKAATIMLNKADSRIRKLESSLLKLKEAVEKHHAEVWGDYWKIEDCTDIELYKVLEEIKLP